MIAVYTALFNDYDNLQPAIYPFSFVFCDQNIKVKEWQVIEVDTSEFQDARYASRYYFNCGHLHLSAYEYTIMHGANAYLKKEPEELIQYLGKNDIACHVHPRKDVYKEGLEVIRMRKDIAAVVNPQMQRYKQERFKGNGLSALALVVKRNTPELNEFCLAVWDEVKNNSHRDQLAFDYVRWKMNYPISRLPGHWRSFIHLYKHNHQKVR